MNTYTIDAVHLIPDSFGMDQRNTHTGQIVHADSEDEAKAIYAAKFGRVEIKSCKAALVADHG